MTSLVTFSRQDRIGLLGIDNPLVNALSPQTVAALIEGFGRFEATSDLHALVIHCAGRVRSNAFGYWTPSPLLTRLASSKQALAGWQPR